MLVPGCHANPQGLSHTDPELDKQMEEKKEGCMDGSQKNKNEEKLQEVSEESSVAVMDRLKEKREEKEKGLMCVVGGVREVWHNIQNPSYNVG